MARAPREKVKAPEVLRTSPELAVRLYAFTLWCVFDSAFMNRIGRNFERQRRVLRPNVRNRDLQRDLALRISQNAIDAFFSHLSVEWDPYLWRDYDADWIIDDLMETVWRYVSEREFECKFVAVVEPYWAAVRHVRQSARFSDEHISLACEACSKLASEIREHRKYGTIREEYAREIADRMLHDRQLSYLISEYVSRLASRRKGARVDRARRTERIRKVLYSRDRGKCAKCHCDIAIELLGMAHIDHIIPIRRGGSNDLINLQLLCSACNLRKGGRSEAVKSSIPTYHAKHRQ